MAATSALMYIWSLPQFQRALAAHVAPDVDLGVQTLVRHLGMFGAQLPSHLGVALGMTRSNVSKIVRRAEAHGLVTREPVDRDGRSILVDLSPAGDVLAAQILHSGDEMMREMTRGWSREELRDWTRLSHRLANAAAEYAQKIINAH
ncbi:MarR family winged helix-turn-helix transcriptional regulator [Georgenia daeguensis]|uniref:MarR family winged helix-turn-helix transcriptional regulator n=1 Tax=Georgenia daeguensis TaxID=908355 RepID=UPI0031EF3C24